MLFRSGDYAIRAAGPESVIEVSYVGYKTVSLVASSSLLAHLTLEEDAMGIDDVVVIGYGTVKKNDMTGSVVAIKAEEFNRGAVVSTQDMLKGKVPGCLLDTSCRGVRNQQVGHVVEAVCGKGGRGEKFDIGQPQHENHPHGQQQ